MKDYTNSLAEEYIEEGFEDDETCYLSPELTADIESGLDDIKNGRVTEVKSAKDLLESVEWGA